MMKKSILISLEFPDLRPKEKIFSYEGKEIPKRDLELIRRILETGEYDE